MQKDGMILSEDNTVGEILEWLSNEPDYISSYFIISTTAGAYKGIISSSSLYNKTIDAQTEIGNLIKRRHISVTISDSLSSAVRIMAKENIDVVPVVSSENNSVIGILSYQNIISSYDMKTADNLKKNPNISLKRQGLKIFVRGQKIFSAMTPKH
jgi:predicted transcriptional regulator